MIGFAPLLQLPLFMGMARDDLQQIVAHTKFDFFKRPADSKVISEGDRCEAVVILTHGSLSVEKQSDDHGYGVREIVNAPLVIQLEQWDPTKAYDRLGIEDEYTTILGIKVPATVVPVKPGRNLAIIIEIASMNNRQKKLGYNAARELMQQLGMDEPEPVSKELEIWH